jgi:predicted nucleotidyltransferase
MTLNEIEKRTILRAVVGSTMHGLNNQDGLEDRDEMGICIEPIKEAIGVGAPFEQFVYRTAAEREGRHDAPSVAGDLDLTIYSLRKYCRLALKGNPTVLTLLFVPLGNLLTTDSRGVKLQELASYFVSKQAGRAFWGYMQAQKQRLLGERGNGGHGAPRSELTAKFGFDTKFAMHMCRLGFQGIELMKTGKLTLPMIGSREWLLDLRQGKVSLQSALTVAGELEAELEDLIDGKSPIPDMPDSAKVEEWMLKMYIRQWSSDRTLEDHVEDYATFRRLEFEATHD